VPEPPAPRGEEGVLAIFRRLDGIRKPLERMGRAPLARSRTPTLTRLPSMERAVRRRYRRGGFGGAVSSVIALGVVGRVPLRPGAMADLITNPAVERAVLGADRVERAGLVFRRPRCLRERFRATLLRRGYGPFRYDLRFTYTCERLDLEDGRVVLRYDPAARPRPEHVTLFRGGCLLVPDGEGTRVAEILVFGTDLQVIPPLQPQLTRLVAKTLRDRATNLWIRAWAGR